MNARDPLQPLLPDDSAAIAAFLANTWDEQIVPALTDYIAIPAKSPMFDADWQRNGHIERVVRDAASWVESRRIAGLKLEVIRLEGRTPVIFFEVPATRAGSTGTICLYGHLDKQPEFNGWRDLGPWTPKYENGLLYGRGGADDGYAIYASITAIEALDRQGIARPRCVGLIETCEESGSFDLPAYLDLLRPRLGEVALVVCLDSGAGNYDQLWLTTSLRGNVTGTLKVEILTEGIHSGDSSGLVPSSFRILRRCSTGWRTRRPASCCRPRSTARCRPTASRRRAPRPRSSATRCGSASLGLRRRWHAGAAHHHRPDAGAHQPHLEAHAQRHRRRRFPRAEERRQRAAPLHGLQALAAPAAAGGRQPRRRRTESTAGRQRALQRQGDLPRRWPRRRAGRERLERADAGAVDGAGAACGVEHALRRPAASSARAAPSR